MGNKFKVGDKVVMQYCDNKIYHGTVVEINSGTSNNLNLCRFINFNGHNGNYVCKKIGGYDTNDYCYSNDYHLEFDNDYYFKMIFENKATIRTFNEKEKEKIEVMKISTITDIKLGTKIESIHQKNAAPKKVECKTVICTFCDGTTETAVCMPEDEFNLVQGVNVCIAKHQLGGTKAYAKYCRNIESMFKMCEKSRKEEAQKKAKYEKEVARKIARKKKRAESEKQNRINEMSTAFLKAMRDYDGIGMDSMIDEETTHLEPTLQTMVNEYLNSKGITSASNNDYITEDDCK